MERYYNRPSDKRRDDSMMPQLNINCPKCRRFLKPTISKLIGELKAQAIGECKKCNIRILNLSTLSHQRDKWISNNYETDIKTFEKYKKQFQEKKKNAKELILDYLAKNRKAVIKQTLSSKLNLKESTISRIIRILRKNKLIRYGFITRYRYGFGARKKYVMMKQNA